MPLLAARGGRPGIKEGGARDQEAGARVVPQGGLERLAAHRREVVLRGGPHGALHERQEDGLFSHPQGQEGDPEQEAQGEEDRMDAQDVPGGHVDDLEREGVEAAGEGPREDQEHASITHSSHSPAGEEEDEVDDLIAWSNNLDFDNYYEDWVKQSCSNGSETVMPLPASEYATKATIDSFRSFERENFEREVAMQQEASGIT